MSLGLSSTGLLLLIVVMSAGHLTGGFVVGGPAPVDVSDAGVQKCDDLAVSIFTLTLSRRGLLNWQTLRRGGRSEVRGGRSE